jgi:glycolate oxidase FAD binding subunit
VVRPDGVIARSGGKVVKNVAGYDLGKLFAGSYGTLGLITEATFRLHPLPAASTWVALELPDPESAAEIVHAICDSPLWPSAVELDWPSAHAPLTVSVLLEGDADSVETRATRMDALVARGMAGDREVADVGGAGGPFRLARPPADGRGRFEANGTCVRVAFWVGQLDRVLKTIRTAAVANAVDPAITGSAGAGVLDVGLGAGSDAADVARSVVELRAGLAALSAGGVVPSVANAVVVWAPPDVQEAVDVWGPVPSLQLMRAVKAQFDPGDRMAPGRFAGGI